MGDSNVVIKTEPLRLDGSYVTRNQALICVAGAFPPETGRFSPLCGICEYLVVCFDSGDELVGSSVGGVHSFAERFAGNAPCVFPGRAFRSRGRRCFSCDESFTRLADGFKQFAKWIFTDGPLVSRRSGYPQ